MKSIKIRKSLNGIWWNILLNPKFFILEAVRMKITFKNSFEKLVEEVKDKIWIKERTSNF